MSQAQEPQSSDAEWDDALDTVAAILLERYRSGVVASGHDQ